MTMTTTCRFCEKLVITLELYKPFEMLMELPNTYNPLTHHYEWRHLPLATYAMIPKSIHGSTGTFELYAWFDEDELDDLDLVGLTKLFLDRDILPAMTAVKHVHIADPVLARPVELGCWKRKHEQLEEYS